MRYKFTPAKNPRVLIIQKVYAQLINNDQKIIYEKHRFKKFIKDVSIGTVERLEKINEEIKNIENSFNLNNLDDIFRIIIQCATFELMYKPSLSRKIIIKEYLNVSNFFLNNAQTKFLNAILDNLSKKLSKWMSMK